MKTETQHQPVRVHVEEEDRFSRFRLITWWEQKRIAAAKVLVIGAGALGNEILKNLALLGFQQIMVVDLDRIEHSNLSRAVLYRTSDVGRFKAEAAAESVKAILPSATVTALNANVLYEVGLGVFAWADVVLAGLDNREARLWINQACWKVNRPWVDGAIEGVNGVARVFLPGHPPCYECTLGEIDWQILEKRLSCNLLTRAEMEGGKVPTTPTTASIIAGIQVQEAVKLLHGLPTLKGEAFVFEGLNHTSYKVSYTANAECMSHHIFERVLSLRESSSQLTLHQLWQKGEEAVGPGTILEFSRDVIHTLACGHCNQEEDIFAAVGKVSHERGRCPRDDEMRTVITAHSYSGREKYGNRTLDQLGLPRFDIFSARNDKAEVAFMMAGDAPQVLGRLHAAGASA